MDSRAVHDAVDGSDGDHAEHRRELVREGFTAALYLSLSLLAVMVAVPSDIAPAESASTATAIFLTALGLIVAHQLAFRLSTRLLHHGRLAPEQLALLGAQLAGGLAVAVVAVIPVLLIDGRPGVLTSELLLIAFIAWVGYAAARMVPVSRVRAAVYMALVVALSLVVVWFKSRAGH